MKLQDQPIVGCGDLLSLGCLLDLSLLGFSIIDNVEANSIANTSNILLFFTVITVICQNNWSLPGPRMAYLVKDLQKEIIVRNSITVAYIVYLPC